MDSPVNAVRKKQVKLVRSMLQKGADPDSTTHEGKCLLSLAIKNHDLNVVKLLLEFNANSNYIEPISEISVLQYALLECFDEVIELLIENGANVNYVTFYGLTPLHLAIERKDEKLVLLLLKRGADPNVKQLKILPLVYAALWFMRAVEDIQLSRGFDTSGRTVYVTPVVVNATKKKLQYRTLRCFLYHDVSAGVEWTGMPALQFAASLGCSNVVKILLDHGALVDLPYETDSECVKPLYAALMNSHDDTACLLIERGADVNTRNQAGRTPLHLAASHGCSKAAEVLINRGVPVDVEDAEKITPLHAAVKGNQQAMVDLLISQHGANVNACSRAELYTGLHYAVENDNLQIALQLLKLGAAVMMTHPNGQPKQRTSLEQAVRRGRNPRLIEILLNHVLEHEAQVDRRDALAHLVRISGRGTDLSKLIVRFLARLDERLQHDFFVRTEIEHFKDFYLECVDELIDMKAFVVYKKLTLHEIFARRGSAPVGLAINKILLGALEKCDYKTRYPIYKDMLNELLNEAKTLKEQYLYLQDALALDLIPNHRLETVPHVVEKILDFFTKDEINKLDSLMHADLKKGKE